MAEKIFRVSFVIFGLIAFGLFILEFLHYLETR